jgi:hypothetical protein
MSVTSIEAVSEKTCIKTSVRVNALRENLAGQRQRGIGA